MNISVRVIIFVLTLLTFLLLVGCFFWGLTQGIALLWFVSALLAVFFGYLGFKDIQFFTSLKKK